MIFETPPGQTINASSFPYVVMRDRVGIFVLGGRIRHYCANIRDAYRVAASFKTALL